MNEKEMDTTTKDPISGYYANTLYGSSQPEWLSM